MRITAHVHKFYDWEPIPSGVAVTEEDVRLNRVKPAAGGGYVMRVTKIADTHTTMVMPESMIIETILQEHIREKSAITRLEAVGHHAARHVMPHHAHKSWINHFEVEDDGPNEELFRAKAAALVAARKPSGEALIEPEDVEELVAKYLKPAMAEHHADHLHTRFGVAKKVATK